MITREELPALRRLDGVDTLRGLSILGVIVLHIWIRFAEAHIRIGRDWPRPLQHFVFFNGGNGVTMFFAISGFLITLTSLRRFGSLADLKPLVFYRIRFARIMPTLLLLLSVLSVLHLAHVDGYVINAKHFTLVRALVAALTFHLNWLEASRDAWLPAVWTVLWSLSIEEMFYLFFPLVSLGAFRMGRFGRVLWVVLALVLFAVGPWARAVWPKTELQAENSYLGGMATIALGCLTALIVNHLASKPMRRAWLGIVEAFGWASIALIAFWPKLHWLNVLGKSGTDDSLLALATCCVIAATTLRRAQGVWITAPLRWMGRLSYELYLSHVFVLLWGIAWFVRRHPQGASRATVAVYVIGIALATLPLGWAVSKFFSEPMNRRLRGAAPAN